MAKSAPPGVGKKFNMQKNREEIRLQRQKKIKQNKKSEIKFQTRRYHLTENIAVSQYIHFREEINISLIHSVEEMEQGRRLKFRIEQTNKYIILFRHIHSREEIKRSLRKRYDFQEKLN